MELEFLIQKNLWWKGKEYIEKDPDYIKWKKKKIRWIPRFVEEIDIKPFALHFLFGPRQVGKTTALKLLVKKLLNNRDEKSIFYFRCDSIKDYKELAELLNTYLEFRDREGIKSSVIMLDEITAVEEWWRTIKNMIDDGVFRKDVLILTGSTSIKIKRQTDLFPGRRENGRDYVLYPLSFKEFVSIVDPELFNRLDTKNIRKNVVYLSELNRLLKIYFSTGGFPLTINSYFENGVVVADVKETYLAWIKNDILKAGKEETIAREILKVVLSKVPSTISWESISKEISVKSPKTVASYISMLEDMFLLTVAYFIDPNEGIVKFGKNKKIHFLDPFFFHLLEEWCMAKVNQKESVIAESVLASHLLRKFGEVFYWKNKKEIDVVVREDGKLKGYECKWREKVKKYKLIVGKIKEVKVLTKSEMSENILPLALFLLAL